MSAAGGEPVRLTYHPGIDAARGWSPDGRRVIIASTPDRRAGTQRQSLLPLVDDRVDTTRRPRRNAPDAGGLPERLPMPRAFTGTYSPDGRRMAYEDMSIAMFAEWAQEQSSQWRHYRGGRTHPIRVIDLDDYSVEKLPWIDSNDTTPMWVGDTVYFLSDRAGTTNLFSYDPRTKQVAQLTRHDDFDIMSASAGPDAIVYEQAGYIHLVDTATRKAQRLSIEVTADFPWARPQLKKVASMIRSAVLSPTGVRAAFEARGDIHTLPAEKGQARNLTASAGVHDRSPVWSPDGAQIAWLSDASGEYQLMIGDQTGATKPRAIPLPSKAFFSAPVWSPDGKLLLLEDNHLNLWSIDIATGTAAKIDTDTYDDPGRRFDAAWSPDSQWVAYSKSLAQPHAGDISVFDRGPQGVSGHRRAVGRHRTGLRRERQVSLLSGEHELRAADRLARDELGGSSRHACDLPGGAERRRAVAVSAGNGRRDGRAAGKPGGSPGAGGKPPADPKAQAPAAVRIDLEGIGQRILALAVPAADYSALMPGSAGTLFYAETPRAAGNPRADRSSLSTAGAQGGAVHRGRSLVHALGRREAAALSRRRQSMGHRPHRPSGRRVGEGAIDVGTLEALIDPRVEWAQIFRETWRIQREFFYDASMHGADWPALYEKYRALLPFVAHRADLGYLIASLAGELAVGHSYLLGARRPAGRRPGAGGNARCRLRHRERALSHQENLRRRELESRAAGAAERARGSRWRRETICSRSTAVR